jgi:hypothetical protein
MMRDFPVDLDDSQAGVYTFVLSRPAAHLLA